MRWNSAFLLGLSCSYEHSKTLISSLKKWGFGEDRITAVYGKTLRSASMSHVLQNRTLLLRLKRCTQEACFRNLNGEQRCSHTQVQTVKILCLAVLLNFFKKRQFFLQLFRTSRSDRYPYMGRAAGCVSGRDLMSALFHLPPDLPRIF